MSDIEAALAEIIDLSGAQKDTQDAARSSQITLSERLKILRERVMAGESTEDRIKDFVLVHYYQLDETIEQQYRSLEENLGKHVGEFILVVKREERPLVHTFGQGGSNYQLFEELFLGVIVGDQLQFVPEYNWNCVLPVESTVYLRERTPGRSLRAFDISDYGRLYKEAYHRQLSGILHETPLAAYEISLGDDAVKAWFAKRGEDNIFDHDGAKTILLFGQMAKLAGRPLDPTEFPLVAEAEAKERERAKLAVITAFGMLLGKQGHAGRFDDIFKRCSVGELEEHLRKTIERAVALGLSEESLPGIQELSKKYGTS